jgi:hypothetical protein
MVAKPPAPIQDWLALQAIRFAALRGTAARHLIQLGGFLPVDD